MRDWRAKGANERARGCSWVHAGYKLGTYLEWSERKRLGTLSVHLGGLTGPNRQIDSTGREPNQLTRQTPVQLTTYLSLGALLVQPAACNSTLPFCYSPAGVPVPNTPGDWHTKRQDPDSETHAAHQPNMNTNAAPA